MIDWLDSNLYYLKLVRCLMGGDWYYYQTNKWPHSGSWTKTLEHLDRTYVSLMNKENYTHEFCIKQENKYDKHKLIPEKAKNKNKHTYKIGPLKLTITVKDKQLRKQKCH